MDLKTLPIGGYDFPVITSRHLTKTVQRTVRRTWKERLLTLPWRPWQAEKVVVETVPSEEIYLVHGRVVCHPAIVHRLWDAVGKKLAEMAESELAETNEEE